MFNRYLKKHAVFPKLIHENAAKETGLIVVIPVYNETSVLLPLQSLQACDTPDIKVEVILVFNASTADEASIVKNNQQCKKEALAWYRRVDNPNYQLYCLEHNDLPKKHAGVGLARKIGMDEAVCRFGTIERKHGVIVCFDADSSCDANYLTAISSHFKDYKNTTACSIHFEHPLNHREHSEEIIKGIAFYELHLRYFKNALAFANLPYAFHTVGSSMAVRVDAYCQQGGMNKRKAGEDFYFLQKFIKQGNFSNLNTTRVIPSPRTSDRVPFGTGRAILEMIQEKRNIENTYSFASFLLLKEVFCKAGRWYKEEADFPKAFIDFVGSTQLQQKIQEIRNQSASKGTFVKRLFHWFDAFQALKFVHFLRDNYFPNEHLFDASSKLLCEINVQPSEISEIKLLETFRKIDRNAGGVI